MNDEDRHHAKNPSNYDQDGKLKPRTIAHMTVEQLSDQMSAVSESVSRVSVEDSPRTSSPVPTNGWRAGVAATNVQSAGNAFGGRNESKRLKLNKSNE